MKKQAFKTLTEEVNSQYPWRVHSPEGIIYCKWASTCLRYKKKYGYGYSPNPNHIKPIE